MAIITTTLVILGKKVLLKGAAGLTASALKEVAKNPEFARTLGKFAENMGIGAAEDVGNSVLEGIEKVGDAAEKLSNLC